MCEQNQGTKTGIQTDTRPIKVANENKKEKVECIWLLNFSPKKRELRFIANSLHYCMVDADMVDALCKIMVAGSLYPSFVQIIRSNLCI